MKFEIIQTNSDIYNSIGFVLRITRNEIINLYQENKDLCYSSIAKISEMFTFPNCFKGSLEPDEVDNIYNKLIEHKSYKVILFFIYESENEYGGSRRNLKIEYEPR